LGFGAASDRLGQQLDPALDRGLGHIRKADNDPSGPARLIADSMLREPLDPDPCAGGRAQDGRLHGAVPEHEADI
jgi:hypothetical protein